MSFSELIVDITEPKEGDIMFILPSKFSSTKYLAPNTFDQATIQNCPVEKITSSGLVGIFSSLKPLGKITIIVFQPIAVMLFYDSKQIEANLKLAGFEEIQINDVKIKDEKTGQQIQTQSIEAIKPESKRNVDINIEIQKTKYKEVNKKEEPERGKYNITKTTKTTTTTTKETEYNPRNRTYVRQNNKEEMPEDKKMYSRKRYEQSNENIESEKPKNRTYVRPDENNKDGKTGYRRKMRFTASNN